MDKRFLFGIILGLSIFVCSSAQLRGMMCLNCNDVSSPKHCQETAICGQGEICSAHEFIDHNGLIGYRLGCEDHRVCALFQEVKSLIGRRDINHLTLPPDRCYQCCATDECNKDLCHGYSGNNLHGFTTSTVSPQGTSCMSCQGVESPEHCRQTTLCGEDEICFTREYTDHQGYQGFRMGCESKTRCDLFLNAASLFGKRHLPEPAPPEGCYNCCSSDECNTGLCRASSRGTTIHPGTITKTTTTQPTTTKITLPSCPLNFVAFKDNCYYFSNDSLRWNATNQFCQGMGADLLSIHSQEEHDFLKQQLLALNARYVDSFVTGGWCVFQRSPCTWEWTDGSPFDYQYWVPSYPDAGGINPLHVILLTNPIKTSPDYRDARMWNSDNTGGGGVLCKKPRM